MIRLRILRSLLLASFLASAVLTLDVRQVVADEFSSTNFVSADPVIFSGSYGTSTSFSLLGVISQISIGTSTSASFGLNSGFLYFPVVTSPVVTATAGNSQVSLSWTASVGSLGWNVSGYNVGQSTASGGPYSYSSVGNVVSSTRTSLTNGTTYYFVVRAEDAFGNSIATSSEVSSTPVAPTPPPPPPSGGGGGGGGGPVSSPSSTRVLIKGRTAPLAAVTILKDGVVVPVEPASPTGNFQAEIQTASGIYTFSIYSIDSQNRKTLTTSFTTSVPPFQTTTISDVVLAPTIGVDKNTVKQGNLVNFFGSAFPQSEINIIVNSETTLGDKVQSDKFGLWSYTLNTKILEKGDHSAKSQTVASDGVSSIFSQSVGFKVGDSDVFPAKVEAAPTTSACKKNGDINNDGRVNIIDFSILLFYWGQRNPANVCANINTTGTVDIFDFSIMLFWWTG